MDALPTYPLPPHGAKQVPINALQANEHHVTFSFQVFFNDDYRTVQNSTARAGMKATSLKI